MTMKLLPEILRDIAHRPGEQGGVVSGASRASYSDIDLLSDRLAKALIWKGVKPGDRVVAVLPNSIEFIIACFGIWKAHAIVVPEYTSIRLPNLRRILEDIHPAALIVDRSGAERLEEMNGPLLGVKAIFFKDRFVPLSSRNDVDVESLDAILESEVDPDGALPIGATLDDVVSITFTGGSTGTPKGVMHTHASWLVAAEFTRDYLGLSESDKIVVPLPLHHGLAFRQILAYLLAGGTVVITTDIYQALRLLRQEHATALLLVPAAVNIAIDHFATVLREADPYLRYVEIGSAAMAPERLEQLEDLLPRTALHLSYGLTEARVGYLKRGADGLFNRIATLSPGMALRLLDNDDRPVPQGGTGEIVLQGRGLMKGYWGEPEFRRETLEDQGFWTGDMGRVDANGEVELLGRLDDVLKVGGRKVNPMEVEMVLNRHPDVVESAVIGMSDGRGIFECTLHAFVVPKKDAKLRLSEIVAHCKRYLEPYKVPPQVHFRSSLPKTSVGKVLRHALVAEVAAGVKRK